MDVNIPLHYHYGNMPEHGIPYPYPQSRAAAPAPWYPNPYPYQHAPHTAAFPYSPQAPPWHDSNRPMNVNVYNSCPNPISSGNAPQNEKKGGGGDQKQKQSQNQADQLEGDDKSNKHNQNTQSQKGGGKKGGDKADPRRVGWPLTVLTGSGNDRLTYDLRDVPYRAILHRATPTLSASYPHQFQPTSTLLPQTLRNAGLFSPPVDSIWIISRHFPWCIHVTGSPYLVLDNLLTQLHEELWRFVQESEYWATTDEKRLEVAAACRSNCASAAKIAPPTFTYGASSDSLPESSTSLVARSLTSRPRDVVDGIRRIDWLVDQTVFVGLEKDDEFVALRVQDKERHPSTWVLTLASNAASRSQMDHNSLIRTYSLMHHIPNDPVLLLRASSVW
ncbi:uncharacterized protein EI90DRAFT_3123822 [Cantharellus anzutake]|uniref:uncharacterized protein n=1 Tax=Cantharellus anzutake TaxID=1750568 RepID=UPI0019068531|nr:uncharacterized protein EI90DRAFT_3123822 [Cantharellus anzutake]KAF8331082.1 hypothetical protein EI90DRAFT_3123822 [Cantharellus anzutake]